MKGPLHYRIIKRAMDIGGALVALILFSPIIVASAFAVYRSMGAPVLFRQTRPGLNQAPFQILKFRTMSAARDSEGKLLPDAERTTRTGRFLRDWSLDELPQLISILRGDMSFVGPRPLLFDFFPYYTPTEMRRHEVRPGITGWAQIHGRNNLIWDKRLEMDVWYVDHWNPWLDLKIIFRTAMIVLKREGITTEGYDSFIRLDDYRRQQMAGADAPLVRSN